MANPTKNRLNPKSDRCRLGILQNPQRVAHIQIKNRSNRFGQACRDVFVQTLLESPYKKIGEAFGGRDHATVINGIKNVETMLKEDSSLQGVLDELSAKIKPTDN